jgi:hypothetical protein
MAHNNNRSTICNNGHTADLGDWRTCADFIGEEEACFMRPWRFGAESLVSYGGDMRCFLVRYDPEDKDKRHVNIALRTGNIYAYLKKQDILFVCAWRRHGCGGHAILHALGEPLVARQPARRQNTHVSRHLTLVCGGGGAG